MYQSTITTTRDSMELTLQFFKDELQKIRAGRANAAIVADLLIEYYGTKTPLKQLATISVPEPRLIMISPFDKNSIKDIEKAIAGSTQGLNAQDDGKIIRIPIPPMTEERRNEVAQMVSQKSEEAKGSLRNLREEAWRQIREMEESGKISEDDKFKAKKDLDEMITEFNSKVEEMANKKKEEVMKI